MAEEKKPFERLPTKVVPRNYKLELTPDLKGFTFKGTLVITVEVSGYSSVQGYSSVVSYIFAIYCSNEIATCYGGIHAGEFHLYFSVLFFKEV